MASPTITCYKCNQNHNKPITIPFKVNCYRCGTIIGSNTGQDIWYDLSNYNTNWNGKSSDSVNQRENSNPRGTSYLLGISIVVVLIAGSVLVIGSIVGELNESSDINSQVQTTDTTSLDTSMKQRQGVLTYTNDASSSLTTPVDEASKNIKIVLSSLITESEIKFDENFKPIASVTLSNTTGKDISQVFFRCDFAAYPLDDGSASLFIYNDGASFVNLTVNLKAGQTKSGQIHISDPGHKDFEKPNISIVKVRYSDGTIDYGN